MSSTLKELVAKDIQDSRYTINPQVTFFKTSYQRHTNFALETSDLSFNKNMTFGSTDTIDISKYQADLVYKLYVKIKINSVDPNGSNFAWVKKLGHAIIQKINITCGGVDYDSQYGTWLDVWNELSGSIHHKSGYDKLIGNVEELTAYNSSKKPEYVLMIPLVFWFNENPFSAFPILNTRLSPFLLTLQLSPKENLFIRNNNFDADKLIISEVSLMTTFVYLDTEERNIFIKKPQEYLMNRVEFSGIEKVESAKKDFVISFDRPHRELIWCMKNGNYTTGEKFLHYTNNENWTASINEASCKIIKESISTSTDPDINLQINEQRTWLELDTGNSYVLGKINITNTSGNRVWYKQQTIGYILNNTTIYLNDKISMDVSITLSGITCANVKSSITVYDLSFPVRLMVDSRFNPNDPTVYQFNNYGVLIDGSINPFIDCGILFNGISRVDVQKSNYFGIVQPYTKHKKIPKNGICIYSFSLLPEEHQPSGTDNLSKIVKIVLTTNIEKYPELNFLKSSNQCWIFGRSLCILRCVNGRSGILNK